MWLQLASVDWYVAQELKGCPRSHYSHIANLYRGPDIKTNFIPIGHCGLYERCGVLSSCLPVIFAELAEAPWQRTWWSQVLRFMHRLDSMDEGSLHPDILSDNIHDTLGNPGCCNWAAGVQKQFASLGVPSPFSGGRVRNVDHLAFRKAMLARDMSVWGGLHISPRGAPSKGAKLCTALRWFARPDRTSTEPYYELPLPVTKLRSIFHFRVGAHSLPVEQGRIQMPKVPRHLRRCTFCATTAIGDERHCVFDCPHFQGLRLQHAEIFRDAHDAMRSVMWHKDQKSVCALVLAIVNEAQTL